MGNDGASQAMTCLSAIREGRRWFDAKMAEHMEEHFPTVAGNGKVQATARVRGDDAYHVAEFFFVARELDLMHRDRLPRLIDRHNADMRALLGDEARMSIMGLSEDRVREAIFSEPQRGKILEGQGRDDEERLRLDQSDIAKLLSPLMATETCRQILLALTEGKLLTRRGSGRFFVASSGILEDYFREHLLIIGRVMRGEA